MRLILTLPAAVLLIICVVAAPGTATAN